MICKSVSFHGYVHLPDGMVKPRAPPRFSRVVSRCEEQQVDSRQVGMSALVDVPKLLVEWFVTHIYSKKRLNCVKLTILVSTICRISIFFVGWHLETTAGRFIASPGSIHGASGLLRLLSYGELSGGPWGPSYD